MSPALLCAEKVRRLCAALYTKAGTEKGISFVKVKEDRKLHKLSLSRWLKHIGNFYQILIG